jgi:hypothetical protein
MPLIHLALRGCCYGCGDKHLGVRNGSRDAARQSAARVPYQSQGFWFILAWKILLRGVEKVEQIYVSCRSKYVRRFFGRRLAFVSTTFSQILHCNADGKPETKTLQKCLQNNSHLKNANFNAQVKLKSSV